MPAVNFAQDNEKSKKSTLKGYAPTPYCDTEWEILSESSSLGFEPLDFEVVSTIAEFEDPLFESFDSPSKSKKTTKTAKAAIAEEKPVFDPALLEAKFKEGLAKGKEAGIAEGKALAETAFQVKQKEIENRLNNFCLEVKKQIEQFFAQVEKGSVKLSLDIARKILASTAQVKPDYIIDVIRIGLKSLGAASPVRIRVSRDDLEFIEVVGLPTDLSTEEIGVQYIADDSIKSGCIIDTDFGEIDLQLDSMWEQVAEQLAEIYK